MSLDLSVLICALPERHEWMYKHVFSKITDVRAEVIYLGDNKRLSVGAKRNALIDIARGKYVVFVDDDDVITEDYCSLICDKAVEDSDVIVFDVACSVNGGDFKPVKYSIKYRKDINHPTWYQRMPNHLMAVKRSIAKTVTFPDRNFGEDSSYAFQLKKKLKTESVIDKTLYYYIFDYGTTQTQR